MEQKMRFQLRPIRIIGYLICLASAFFLYSVLRSYFLWLAIVIMLLFPALSVAGTVYLCGNLVPEISADRKKVFRSEAVLVELRLRNPVWFLALHTQMKLAVSNTFLERQEILTAVLPTAAHQVNSLKLSFGAEEQGRYVISCDMLRLRDMMGFFDCKKPVSLSEEFYVLPHPGEAGRMDVTGFMEGAAEREESRYKGNDFSQVSDVREYLPGDRLRDIHWKLSARQDTLMVKERVSAAGSEMMLLLDLTEDAKQAEQILELAVELGQSLTGQRLPVCFLCWSRPAFQWEEYRCGTGAELEEAFCGIFGLSLSERVNERAQEHMRNFYPHLRSYLAVTAHDGVVKAVMRENG